MAVIILNLFQAMFTIARHLRPLTKRVPLMSRNHMLQLLQPRCLVFGQIASFTKYDRDGETSFDESMYAGRSNLFGADPYLEEVRKRMKKDVHEEDRFQGDLSEQKVRDRTGEQRQPERVDLVYSSDL